MKTETREDAMLRRIENARRVFENCKHGTRARDYWQGIYNQLIRTAHREEHKKYYNPIRVRQGEIMQYRRPKYIFLNLLKRSFEAVIFIVACAGYLATILLVHGLFFSV